MGVINRKIVRSISNIHFFIFSKVYDYGSMEMGYAHVYQVLQDQEFQKFCN